MAIGIIVGIIIAIAVIAFGAWFLFSAMEDGGSKAVISGILCLVSIIAFVVVPFSFHTVQTGELAVVRKMGKITHVRDAGTNFDLWFINAYQKYDTKVQNVDIITAAYSSDAQTMDIAMTLQYQVMPDKVIDIATQYGSLEILQNRIQSIAIEKTKAVLSSYKAMDIIAHRSQISPAVEEAIKAAVGDEYFVRVNTVVLSNIDFSDAFEAAVEDKMIAEQTKLKADYENQTKVAQAEAEAEAKLKAAQAEIEIAKAEAEALKIAADAEAEANRIITESLNEKIIEKNLVEAWNGEMPKVVGNGEYILPTDILG